MRKSKFNMLHTATIIFLFLPNGARNGPIMSENTWPKEEPNNPKNDGNNITNVTQFAINATIGLLSKANQRQTVKFIEDLGGQLLDQSRDKIEEVKDRALQDMAARAKEAIQEFAFHHGSEIAGWLMFGVVVVVTIVIICFFTGPNKSRPDGEKSYELRDLNRHYTSKDEAQDNSYIPGRIEEESTRYPMSSTEERFTTEEMNSSEETLRDMVQQGDSLSSKTTLAMIHTPERNPSDPAAITRVLDQSEVSSSGETTRWYTCAESPVAMPQGDGAFSQPTSASTPKAVTLEFASKRKELNSPQMTETLSPSDVTPTSTSTGYFSWMMPRSVQWRRYLGKDTPYPKDGQVLVRNNKPNLKQVTLVVPGASGMTTPDSAPNASNDSICPHEDPCTNQWLCSERHRLRKHERKRHRPRENEANDEDNPNA